MTVIRSYVVEKNLPYLPINTAEKTIQVITWYLFRWQIAIFLKLLKVAMEPNLQHLYKSPPARGDDVIFYIGGINQ